MSEKQQYRSLNFSHTEINDLLTKVQDNHMLTEDEYKKLFEEIGLDNISTFSGDFNDLLNKPMVCDRLSGYINDTKFQTQEQVDAKILELKIALEQAMSDLHMNGTTGGSNSENVNNEELNLIQQQLNKLAVDMENKANKEELFNKDFNELINKPEIPSLEGLATEEFVNGKIDENKNMVDTYVKNIAAQLGEKANKEELFSKDFNDLMNKPEIPSIEGLATEEFVKAEIEAIEHPMFDDSELQERIDILETINLESKPYIDKNGMLVLCGCSAIARGVGEEVHVTVRFFNNAEDKFVFTAEEFAKTRICMGYGAEGVGAKRNIVECTLELRDLDKVWIIDGGSQTTGEIGTVNIIAENVNYIDGIQGARAMNGGERNIVHNFNVKIKDVKLIDTVFGGGNGYSVVWNNKVEIDGDTEINILCAGGSNGFTRRGHVVVNDGNIKIFQGVNRGIIEEAKLIVNGGHVEKFYAGGDAEDKTVNGMIRKSIIELNNGEIDNFFNGTNNGVEFEVENIEGIIAECVVGNGDISMLEEVEMPADPKPGDCVFNERLNKPMWFNGKNWVDANGSIVG